ncbi:MAG: KOW domain-containing RNA-binding protein [Oscillospiraceae bacterium]|nr:KOW domain-containing RNA-binding protein [Oscillospiraceae bacterium]
MEIIKGCVVRSASGRDARRFYLVVKVEDGFVWIADGKVHLLEKPKRKNPKHLRKTNTQVSVEDVTTNNQLKRLLHPFNYPVGQQEGNG